MPTGYRGRGRKDPMYARSPFSDDDVTGNRLEPSNLFGRQPSELTARWASGQALCSVSSTAGAEYAEFVTLWVGQHDPRLLPLTHVRSGSSKGEHPLNLSVPIVRSEVEMESVLNRLGLRDGAKEQPRQSTWRWSNLEFLRIVIHDNPSECFLPPPSQSIRISCVNECLLPLQSHVLNLGGLTECGQNNPSCFGKTDAMAFGQQSGPPASTSQVKELVGLLTRAGYADFRQRAGQWDSLSVRAPASSPAMRRRRSSISYKTRSSTVNREFYQLQRYRAQSS